MKRFFLWIIKHKIATVLIIVALLVLPIIIVHVLFKLEAKHNFFIAEWSAGDVLCYIGAFYAFLGTASLGALSLWQNITLREESTKEINRRVELDAEPIFVVKLEGLNSLHGVGAISLGPRSESIKVDNFVLSITNSGKHDVFNVVVFEDYVTPRLKIDTPEIVYCAFSDVFDENKNKDALHKVDISTFERDANSKYPKFVQIHFDDILGNMKYHTFELRDFGGKYYYSRKNEE